MIIGILNKNEYLAQDTLSRPRKTPVLIVEPEREIPGIEAIPCASPIRIAFFISILSVFTFIFSATNSPVYKIQPVRNINMPTMQGRFISFSDIIFSGYATIIVKNVPIIIKRPSFASVSEKSRLIQAFINDFVIFTISSLKNIRTASSVPR